MGNSETISKTRTNADTITACRSTLIIKPILLSDSWIRADENLPTTDQNQCPISF